MDTSSQDLRPGRRSALLKLMALGAAGAGASRVGAQPASADLFPRGIRMVIPFAPGGLADSLGRPQAEVMTRAMGAQVIVENKPGAGLMLALNYVHSLPPDSGAFVYVGNAYASTLPLLTKEFRWDVKKDFAPIGLSMGGTYAVAVNPSLPVSNMRELLAYLKANPGKVNYGTQGNGTAIHMGTELFKQKAGVDMVHVPFKGSAPAILALMANQIQFYLEPPMNVMQYVKAGKLKLLAVTSAQRDPFVPDLPTTTEAGVPFEFDYWGGYLVHGNAPRAQVDRLNAGLLEALKDPRVLAVYQQLGVKVLSSTPQEMQKLIIDDLQKWSTVLKQADIKLS